RRGGAYVQPLSGRAMSVQDHDPHPRNRYDEPVRNAQTALREFHLVLAQALVRKEGARVCQLRTRNAFPDRIDIRRRIGIRIGRLAQGIVRKAGALLRYAPVYPESDAEPPEISGPAASPRNQTGSDRADGLAEPSRAHGSSYPCVRACAARYRPASVS